MSDLYKQIIIGVLLLAAIILVETYTDIDVWLQNYFYDINQNEWIISREMHQNLSIFFYKGIKSLIIGLGIISLLIFAFSFKYKNLQKYRRASLLMFLSIVFVPVIIAGSKQITNVYCPDQLLMYGGKYPWVRILENYPEGFEQLKRGKCFPAGHATVGFSLMMLYFCFNTKSAKYNALAVAFILGLTTGIYQMLRGDHFLSHTLFTMVASWMVIIILNAVVSHWLPDKKLYKSNS